MFLVVVFFFFSFFVFFYLFIYFYLFIIFLFIYLFIYLFLIKHNFREETKHVICMIIYGILAFLNLQEE